MGLSNVLGSQTSVKMVDSLEAREFISKSRINKFTKYWNKAIEKIASSFHIRAFSKTTIEEMKTKIQDSAKNVIKNEKLDLTNFYNDAPLHAKFVADNLWKGCTGKPVPGLKSTYIQEYANLRDAALRAMFDAVKEIKKENEMLAQKETSENTAPHEAKLLPEHLQNLVNDQSLSINSVSHSDEDSVIEQEIQAFKKECEVIDKEKEELSSLRKRRIDVAFEIRDLRFTKELMNSVETDSDEMDSILRDMDQELSTKD